MRTLGTGRDIYLHRARAHLPPPVRIAAGLAAARAFVPEVPASPAWLLEGPDDAMVLTNRRTGRRYQMRAELEHERPRPSRHGDAPPAEAPVALGLADLPDRQRMAIAAVLRG